MKYKYNIESIDKIKKELHKINSRIKVIHVLLEKSNDDLKELQQELNKGVGEKKI